MTKYIMLFLFAFFLGKFSYGDSSGLGVFIPNVGGYHYSLTDSEDSGAYK